MLHHTCTDYQEWLARHRRYAAWEICMNGKKVWPRDPIASRELLKKLLRSLVLRPELIFLHSYILKLGFLDGVAGFHFAKSRWRYYHNLRVRMSQNLAVRYDDDDAIVEEEPASFPWWRLTFGIVVLGGLAWVFTKSTLDGAYDRLSRTVPLPGAVFGGASSEYERV